MRLGVLLALAPLMAGAALAASAGKGDPKRGEVAFQKCFACHALEPGRNFSGPSLAGILGRRIAADPDFDYSPALRALARSHPRWDATVLGRYIADPEAVAPRTSMTFTGIRSEQERADLIAYLAQPAK